MVHNRVDCPVPYSSAPSLASVKTSSASLPRELRRSLEIRPNESSWPGNLKGNCSCWAKQCASTRGKLAPSIFFMRSSISQQSSGPWSGWIHWPCVLERSRCRKSSRVSRPDIPSKMTCGVLPQDDVITSLSETTFFLNHPSSPIPYNSSLGGTPASELFEIRQ